VPFAPKETQRPFTFIKITEEELLDPDSYEEAAEEHCGEEDSNVKPASRLSI
jgi:hypothetical protein